VANDLIIGVSRVPAPPAVLLYLKAMEVALFVTCLVDQVAPATGRAAVALLEAAGCRVSFPAAQTCCGQPAFNSGYPDDARRLARHHLDVFDPYEAVVAPSGSCAAMVHHYYPTLWPKGSPLQRRAEAMAGRTYELTQFLVDVLGRPDLGVRIDATVTYHASCHLLRELHVREAPRTLLEQSGITITDMPDAERCCGFGGTFSLTHPEISVPMADWKLDQAVATGAGTLVACDTGCLMHLAARAEARHLPLTLRHAAEVIAEGLQQS
jgi:L-lactate dehydrogenase complex protein LldE